MQAAEMQIVVEINQHGRAVVADYVLMHVQQAISEAMKEK